MGKVIKNVVVSSIMALVLYFVVALLWMILAAIVTSQSVRFVLVGIMTSIGYCLCLLYIAKVRYGDEREVFEDYKVTQYEGILKDVKHVWRREAKYVYIILAICASCFILSSVNGIFFERAVISFPTLIFFPIIVLSSNFSIDVIGYVVSAIFVSIVYLLCVLIYRRRQTRVW